MAIEKKKLVDVLHQILDEEKSKMADCYWIQCPPNLSLRRLCIMDIGTVSIPISSQNVESIRRVQILNPCSKISLDGSSIRLVEDICLKYAEMALEKLLGCHVKDKQVELNLVFQQLSISSRAGKQTTSLHTMSSEHGIVGKFVLQIPVEGGHHGGDFIIEEDGKIITYKSDEHSDRFCCYTLLRCGNGQICQYEWQPIERGCLVTLNFSILWRPSTSVCTDFSSITLTAFLVAVKLAEESLRAWDVTEENSVDLTIRASVASRGKILIIPLRGQYHETNFNFPALVDVDLQMVHILQSIGFIDVHLAIVEQTRDPSDIGNEARVPTNSSFEIAQWIYDRRSIPQFKNYQLEFPSQLVGVMQTFMKSDFNSLLSRHPVLVIQPIRQSIQNCCCYHFDAILKYLETNQTNLHQFLLTCLRQTLLFCQKETLKVWGISDDVLAAERTRRLLKICQNLKAGKEAAILIELLGKDIPNPPTLFNEGIRNDLVARSITDLVWNSGGWKVFEGPVLGLITRGCLVRQLKHYATMIVALAEYGCILAASSVALKIYTTLEIGGQEFEWPGDFGQSNISAYVEAIIALESHRDSFYGNRTIEQGHFLLDQSSNQELDHPSCKGVLLKIGYSLLSTVSSSLQWPPIQTLVDILKYFLDLKELSLTQKLLNRIGYSQECLWNLFDKCELFRIILSTPQIWKELAQKEETSEYVRDLLRSWGTALVQILDTFASDAYEKARFLRYSIAECFSLFIKQQKVALLSTNNQQEPGDDSNSFGNDIFSPLVHKLSSQKLGQVIWDIYQFDVQEQTTLKNFITTSNLYSDLCIKFVKGDLVSIFKSTQSMVEVTECLLWFGDIESISPFFDKILACYPSNQPNCLLERIAKSPQIRLLATSCPCARDNLCDMLRKRILTVTEILEGERNWKMLNTFLPKEHQIVQEFLHSSEMEMVYASFSNVKQAELFASLLRSQEVDNGYAVLVNISGQQYSTSCRITKIRDCPLENDEIIKEALLSEKSELENILAGLEVEVLELPGNYPGAEPSAENMLIDVDDDELEILPTPAKKVKIIDEIVIE